MIKSFYVENYKSWKEPSEISFVATSIGEHPQNIFEVDRRKEKLLKNIAIYGANASGKSNLVNAIHFMHSKIMEYATQRNLTEFIETSKNSSTAMLFRNMPLIKQKCHTYAQSSEGTTFEISFLKFGNEYSYGFEIKKGSIRKEWLDINGTIYFERKKNTQRIKEFAYILQKIPNDVLYISYLNEFSKMKVNDPIRIVFNFFSKISFVKDLDKLNDIIINDVLIYYINNREGLLNKLKNFLRIVDFGIKDIVVDQNTNQINIIHNGKNGDFPLPLGSESDGTKKMLLVLVNLLANIESGGLVIADEFTTSLHPLLSKVILDIISDSNINKKNTQFLFTSHDVFLMSKEQFRRDEILFVYKDDSGISSLGRLYDIKDSDMNRVRNDVVYYKNYLKGVYKGTPKINFQNFKYME